MHLRRHVREGDDPVRRDLSILLASSLEYWMPRAHRCAMPGTTRTTHGGGTLVIGLRCASAATVDVPIGPCSS